TYRTAWGSPARTVKRLRGVGGRGTPPAVRPRAIGARSADRGERGFGRRGRTGADPVGGSGAISDHHRRADVHARWRAPGNRASSRAAGARRGAGGHTGGGAGVAGSRREAACLRGARGPLRGPGGGATAADRERGRGGGGGGDRQIAAGLDLGST